MILVSAELVSLGSWFGESGYICGFLCCLSASPKPHPSKPHPCNMPQRKTEVALQFSESCAAETALQHWLFCSADAIFTRSCAATKEKLHCNIEKAALQESGALLPLSCGFQAPTLRRPAESLLLDFVLVGALVLLIWLCFKLTTPCSAILPQLIK